MFAEGLDTQLLSTLERPDLRVVAGGRRILFDAQLDTPFRADPDGQVVLGPACLGPLRICAFHLRHALELSMLLDAPASGADAPVAGPELPVLAGLFAARTASRFWLLDEAPAGEPPVRDPAAWLAPMASPTMPDPDTLRVVWMRVRHLQGPAYRLQRRDRRGGDGGAVPDAVLRVLGACWDLTGPAETLMAQGGDARLAVAPRTGLNHYGCSHRPRPWAITFASSTASSLSERGFDGAEQARKRVAVAALAGRAGLALERETEQVRGDIAAHYGLPDGSAIVLAASGTDLEMIALALCALPDGSRDERRPISNILLAPEETGAGVPLAAAGRHFAADTARGRPVAKGERIEGFADDTRLISVSVRDPSGRRLPADEVDAACTCIAAAEAEAGRTVLLHRLDLSKTGLLAPGMDCLEGLGHALGDRLEVVVDACQARLDRRRVQADVARGWMVMVTGSKFFTGPPFCGALLLPPRLARRLDGPGRLPEGLRDYGGRADWPRGSAVCTTPSDEGTEVNFGMVLRWQAALAEMRAFATVPDSVARARTAAFVEGVEAEVAASPDVAAVEVPPPRRDPLPEPSWDELQTIRSFMVLEPPGPAGTTRRPLAVEPARRVYRWLNADVSAVLPQGSAPEERALARLLCHIGQPAPVAHDQLDGVMAGALRISVGARLLSGEPSHEGLGGAARMAREIGDVRRIIAKIGLLLRHWDALLRLDPEPRFASDLPLRRRADPGLNI